MAERTDQADRDLVSRVAWGEFDLADPHHNGLPQGAGYHWVMSPGMFVWLRSLFQLKEYQPPPLYRCAGELPAVDDHDLPPPHLYGLPVELVDDAEGIHLDYRRRFPDELA